MNDAPVRTKFLSFSMPDVQEEDIQAAVEVMRSGWLSTGKEATKFEEAFVQYKGGKVGAVALSSCTAALHLALESIPVRGYEVIVPSMTFSATAAAVIHAGGIPVFADVQLGSQNISIDSIKEKVGPLTRAIVVVHFAGYPCDMKSIQDFCNGRGIFIIEDCAHAIETKYDGIPVGTQNYAGCFSFYGTKNITTAVGEGGMLISKHPRVIEFARKMALHGMSKNAADRFGSSGFKHYDILAPGYKYNMPDVSAAFANSQLKRIDHNWAIRKSIWDRYHSVFSNILGPIVPINVPAHHRHAYHLYTICVNAFECRATRNEVLEALTEEGIGVGVHYTALHNMKYWQHKYNLKASDYPAAQWLSDTTISLPLTASLEPQDVEDVINAVKKVFAYYQP